MTEWYRRKSWTQVDEQEFFNKLNRARAHGRAQYLRIQALAFEKVFPNVITSSYLDFSELVVKTSNQSLYELVATLLEDRLENQPFPVTRYKMCCLLSIIKHEKGDLDKAEYYRQLAEQNASAKTSGLRYHKYLGIVNKRVSWLDKLKK